MKGRDQELRVRQVIERYRTGELDLKLAVARLETYGLTKWQALVLLGEVRKP